MNLENISPFGSNLLDRRGFMRNTAFSLGGLGLAHLLKAETEGPLNFAGKRSIRPDINPDQPYLPRSSHFESAAKRVLVI